MHLKINFLLLIPSFQHKSMKTNLNNNIIHFHGCKVKATKVKFYASFKCFFHHFKSSAEATLLKEPPSAVKQHFWTCPILTFFYQSTETKTRKVNGAAGEKRRSCGGKGERKVSSLLLLLRFLLHSPTAHPQHILSQSTDKEESET